MNTERKGVDVLAVMDAAASTCEAYTAKTVFRGGDAGFVREFSDGGLREARAAVAELIDAADALVNRTPSIWVTSSMDPGKQVINLENLQAALKRVGVGSK